MCVSVFVQKNQSLVEKVFYANNDSATFMIQSVFKFFLSKKLIVMLKLGNSIDLKKIRT
jgi:hypothetical protein